MAKSLGNFITIREFLKKYPARPVEEFRKDFSLEKSNLRSPVVKFGLAPQMKICPNPTTGRSNSKFLYGARVLRLSVTKTLYRSPIDYGEKEIEGVKRQLERLDGFVEKLTTHRA